MTPRCCYLLVRRGSPAFLSQPTDICRAQLGGPPRAFQAVTEGRLCSFLEEWRRGYDKSLARERQAKVASVENRNKEAKRLAQKASFSGLLTS